MPPSYDSREVKIGKFTAHGFHSDCCWLLPLLSVFIKVAGGESPAAGLAPKIGPLGLVSED